MDLESLSNWPTGKVGVVAVVGRPNVGKSTFLNQVLGAHLLAVSPLPQTTRQHWRGILSDEESQIVFVDTPGAHIGSTRLNEAMLHRVDDSLKDADVILCLTDPTRAPGEEDELVAQRVHRAAKPAFLVLNKSDVTDDNQRSETETFYRQILGTDVPCYHMSALTGEKTDTLLAEVRAQLGTGPFFYPADQVMDAYERDIGSEIIREAALQLLREEVPHAIAVEIMQWRDTGKKLQIKANIFVDH